MAIKALACNPQRERTRGFGKNAKVSSQRSNCLVVIKITNVKSSGSVLSLVNQVYEVVPL